MPFFPGGYGHIGELPQGRLRLDWGISGYSPAECGQMFVFCLIGDTLIFQDLGVALITMKYNTWL